MYTGMEWATYFGNLGTLLVQRNTHQPARAAHLKPEIVGICKQLSEAITLCEQLSRDFPLNPHYREELANSQNNLGFLFTYLDQLENARNAYQVALSIRAKLAEDFPSPRYLRDLGSSYNNFAALLMAEKRFQEAEAAFQKALSARKQLSTTFPDRPQYESDLADTLHNLGLLLHDQKWAGAEAAYRDALKIRTRLSAQHPDVPEYLRAAAASHQRLGIFLANVGKGSGAEVEFQSALNMLEGLSARFPDIGGNEQRELGRTLVSLAILRGQRDKPEALRLFDKGIACLRPPRGVGSQSLTAVERRWLRYAYRGRANALCVMGRPGDAIADWDRAVELSSGLENTADRADRARTLVRAGLVERALSEAEELAKLPAAPAALLYKLACVHALAAERDGANREKHARNGLRLLRRATDGGFRGPLAEDEDLKSLQDYQEFRELIKPIPSETPDPGGGRRG